MISTIDTTNPALEKFYSTYYFFSYSSLNKLLYSADSFYKWYILKDRSDSLDSYLVEGRVIHCLLLDKDKFNEQFIIMPGDVPGVSNKKIIESVYSRWKYDGLPTDTLKNYEQVILQWLVDNNLHQSLKDDKDLTKTDAKTGDQKRLEKVLTIKANEYFDYLKLSGKKDVISQETYDYCCKAVDIIKSDKKITELLKIGDSGFELLEVHNEKDLSCTLQKYPFGLKGIVDNYVIDHNAKTVTINDLKTTSKTLREFKDTVDYYKYWMQGAIYIRLVQANHPETVNYKFSLNFIVFDKYQQVYPFPVSEQSMIEWQNKLEEILNIAKYHYTNKDYKLPYEFALNQIIL